MPPRARTAVLAACLALGSPAGFGQLALHLTFDQAGNLAVDSSGNGHVASPTGSVTYTASGISGGAGVFSGGAYYSWTGGPAATFTGSFTTSLWVKTTQSYGGNGDRGYEGVGIVYADQPGQAMDTIPLALNGSVAGFMTSNGTTDTTIHSTSAINTGSFVHLVATYDHATGVKKLYFNGTLQATETVASTSHNARNLLVLGANDFDGRHFNGTLDDFQFYSKALSATEVAYLFNNPGLTAVPEPGVALLLGLGLLPVAAARRRRRHS